MMIPSFHRAISVGFKGNRFLSVSFDWLPCISRTFAVDDVLYFMWFISQWQWFIVMPHAKCRINIDNNIPSFVVSLTFYLICINMLNMTKTEFTRHFWKPHSCYQIHLTNDAHINFKPDSAIVPNDGIKFQMFAHERSLSFAQHASFPMGAM